MKFLKRIISNWLLSCSSHGFLLAFSLVIKSYINGIRKLVSFECFVSM